MNDEDRNILRDRDNAIIEVILTGKDDKMREFCNRNGLSWPADPMVRRATAYKAAQYCPRIPEAIKRMAREKARAMGVNPYLPEEVVKCVLGKDEDKGQP